MKKALSLATIALALAFVPNQIHAAVGDLILKVSGKAVFPGTSSDKGNIHTTTTITKTFTQADIYAFVSNSVANISQFTSIIPTKPFPADGYIAYNPRYETNMFPQVLYDTTYTNITGLFYVTNRSGFFFPLSGRDTNGNYYSFIELNTSDSVMGKQGFGYPFTSIPQSSINRDTGDGTITDTETASLYIHNNPFIVDESDQPGNFYFVTPRAIEIRGVLAISFKSKKGKTTTSGTLNGTGNIKLDSGSGVITLGKATFTTAP